jgi:putative chitinase
MTLGYDKFLSLCGKLNNSQREGMNFLLGAMISDPAITDVRWMAYMLATVGRECGGEWQPIEEYGKGTGEKYCSPDPVTRLVYYGRGFVQLTWAGNYKTMGKILGVDLYNSPDLALEPATAYRIMSYGMTHGTFTGARLAQHINADKCDYVNARRIINGTDHADEIAKAAQWFEETLNQCLS